MPVSTMLAILCLLCTVRLAAGEDHIYPSGPAPCNAKRIAKIYLSPNHTCPSGFDATEGTLARNGMSLCMLSVEELAAYRGGGLTIAFVRRVFQECQTYRNEMDYKASNPPPGSSPPLRGRRQLATP